MRVSGFLLVGDLKPDLDKTKRVYQGPYRYLVFPLAVRVITFLQLLCARCVTVGKNKI